MDNFDAIKHINANKEAEEQNENSQIQDDNKTVEKEKPKKKPFKWVISKFNFKIIGYTAIVLIFFVVIYYFYLEKFDLVTQQNKTYRLNKITGEVIQIKESGLFKIANSKKDLYKTWEQKDIPQLDGINLLLSTNWRDGKLYYNFNVFPYSKRLKKIIENGDFIDKAQGFNISLQDEKGFNLIKIDIPLSKMTRMLGDTKGSVSGLVINDSIQCSYDDYADSKNWDIEWTIH